ncbi:MAG: hypothetical protein ACQEXQ_15890 [Bacillota bacterium]
MLKVTIDPMPKEELEKRRREMRKLVRNKVQSTPNYQSERDPSWEKFIKKINAI